MDVTVWLMAYSGLLDDWLIDDWLMIGFWLVDGWLMISWWFVDDWLVFGWWLVDAWLTIGWQLVELMILTLLIGWWLADDRLVFAWWLVDDELLLGSSAGRLFVFFIHVVPIPRTQRQCTPLCIAKPPTWLYWSMCPRDQCIQWRALGDANSNWQDRWMRCSSSARAWRLSIVTNSSVGLRLASVWGPMSLRWRNQRQYHRAQSQLLRCSIRGMTC